MVAWMYTYINFYQGDVVTAESDETKARYVSPDLVSDDGQSNSKCG